MFTCDGKKNTNECMISSSYIISSFLLALNCQKEFFQFQCYLDDALGQWKKWKRGWVFTLGREKGITTQRKGEGGKTKALMRCWDWGECLVESWEDQRGRALGVAAIHVENVKSHTNRENGYLRWFVVFKVYFCTVAIF